MVVTRATKQKQTLLNYYQPLVKATSQSTDHSVRREDNEHEPSKKRRRLADKEHLAHEPKPERIDLPTPQPSSRPSGITPPGIQVQSALEPTVESSCISPSSIDEDGDEVVLTSSRTRPYGRRAIILSDDDESVGSSPASQDNTVAQPDRNKSQSGQESYDVEDEDEDIKLPVRKRRHNLRCEPTPESSPELTECQQLKDDLNDLEANSLQETRTRPAGVSLRRATQNDQLQLLKARREAKQRGEDVQLPDTSDLESVVENPYNPFFRTQEDEDFLSDDDNAEDFTDRLKQTLPMFAITSIEEAFETVVDYLIRRHLQADSGYNAEKYEYALRKVDNQASTYAGSKFSSSAWRPDFYRVLNARPRLEDQPLVSLSVDGCQACGRTSHPATWRLRFTGPAYDRKTLGELQDDYDEDGNAILSEDYEFFVGNECRKNAVYAHSFRHWRFHLSSQVRDYLVAEGYLAAEDSALLDSLEDSDRPAWAETALEAMKADQTMDELFTSLRDAMEHANSGMVGLPQRLKILNSEIH